MNRLRVGIVVPRFAPFNGGVETYVATAAEAMAREGVDVTVITQMPGNAQLPGREERAGYTVVRYRLPVTATFGIPSPSAASAVSQAGHFDVTWVHSYHTPLAWLAAEQSAAPVVFTPHYHGVGHTPPRQVLHSAYRPLGRRLMAASRRIVVDTDAEASLVLRDFPRQVTPDKITVVPPAVVDPVPGPRPCPGISNVVLTIARQERYKRTDLLIRAVAKVRDRGVPARLVVVGEGSALMHHRQLAAQLGVEEAVRFTGAVSDADLGLWWALAALYATASEQEAYGIGLAGALIAGLPVVASDIPAHREVARLAGPEAASQLCPTDGDDSELSDRYADAITRLLPAASDCRRRAAFCALPSTSWVAGRLIETLTEASETGAARR